MTPSRRLQLQLALCLLVSIVFAKLPTVWKPYDVVTYFCERWYHQSVVKNNTLFIHGGIQTFNLPQQANWTNSTLGYNQFMLKVDLREWWNWRTNITYIALEETPNPTTGSKVRDAMVAGTMFHGPYTDSSIYTYGGTTFRGNESFPSANTKFQYSEENPLWSFDDSNQLWNTYDINQTNTPSYGAAAEAPDQGLAFYLNGRIDNGTASSRVNDGDTQTLLDGMVVIDLVQHTARNVSTAGMKNYQPRVGGALQYVPGVGNSGVLVALGGKVFDGKKTTSSLDKGRLLSYDTVDVFDIGSYLDDSKLNGNGAWHSQTTSGNIPPPRIDTCTVITSAPDNSSHNIWLYGGRDPTGVNGTIYYDDVYVLSLPSFTWIGVYQGTKPRWGHTCHLVGGNQMLTVGGHNELENICDWHTTGVGMLDLSRVVWGSVFQASGNNPVLNYKIVDKIGGTLSGGANKTVPDNGWVNNEFSAIINTRRTYDNFKGTIAVQRPETSRMNSNMQLAIIVGASVGGTVFLILISLLTYLHRRHRRASALVAASKPRIVGEMEDCCKFELPGGDNACEVNGLECINECPATPETAEVDGGDGNNFIAELPTTNFGEDGRWGVPVVRAHSPSSIGSEQEMSWRAGDDQLAIVRRNGEDSAAQESVS